ncbi:MAG: O-antigen ligase family protein, partial [Chloroflexota bacterium]|nr:O-antigen ligase family protein [Chloroflexota bacterium]
ACRPGQASYKLQVARGRSRPTFHAPHFTLHGCDGVFAALVGLGLISTLAAEESALAWAAFWRVMALPGLVYLLIRTLPREGREMWPLVNIWVVSSVAAAGMGLYQFLIGRTIPAEGVQRVAGPYSSPNHLALFLERAVPMLAAVALGSRHHRRRWAYGLALLPILAALYLTYSRAAWLLALPASLLFLGLVGGGRWRRLMWLGIPLTVGVTISWQGTERMASLLDLGRGTSALRLQAWRGVLGMIRAHPLLGVGPGNFHFVYPRYMRPTAWAEPLLYHSHNVFLDFAAFLGLGGLMLFGALLMGFFRAGWRLLRTLHTSEERALLVGLMAAAVGSLAHGLVDNGYFLPDLACLWALILGLVDRLKRTPTKRSPAPSPPIPR